MDGEQALKTALADRYAIESEIDSGGMATVHRARDLKHDRTVAIKVLRPDLAETIGADRFLKEIRTTANLSHPHILPLFDSGEAEGFLYYVMPFIKGESLADRLEREGQLPVEDAVQIAREVGGALAYAHREGVMHRDIKPANIMLEEGHALLADFGIAQAKAGADETRLTGMGMSLGTPAYMSPEQISGDSAVDGRSDQYALACVLYEMLAGHPPFTGADIQTVMRQHLAAEAPKVTGARATVPTGVARALHRGLAKTPADRYRTVAEFEKALAGATLPLWARIPMGRARAVGYALVAVAVVALGSSAWGSWRSGGGSGSEGASQPDPQRIAVAPFENRTGDAAFERRGEWIAAAIEERLSGAMIGEVVGAPRIIPTLRAAGVETDPVTVLSRDLGAGTVVTGAIDLQGGSLEIRASCIDAATGTRLTAVDPVKGGLEELDALVAEIGSRVAGALAMLLDPVSSPQGSAFGAPPRNPEAYEEFRRGMELQAIPEDWGVAIDHFFRAWALDSTFYSAAIMAVINTGGATEMGLGDWGEERDSVRAYLARSESRMTRGERYLFNVYTGHRGGTEEALRVARDASEEYPREFAYSRGMLALAMHRTREAVAAFKLLEREEGGFREEYVRNWPFYFNQYSDALHRLGEHEKELEVVLEGRRRFPDFPLLMEAESAARIALRQEEEIRAVIAEERREGNTDRIRLIARELFAHGLPDLAREVLADELDRFDNDPYYDDARRVADVLHMLGRDEEAMAIYREVAEAHPDNPWQGHYQMGVVAASQGDTALALEVDRRIADWPREAGNSWSFPLVRAQIHARLGRREEAFRLLEKAFFQQGRGVTRADHTIFDLLPLKGYPPFDELMRGVG